MANFGTEASFLVPLSSGQAQTAMKAYELLMDCDLQDDAQLIPVITKAKRSEDLDDVERIIIHCLTNHPEAEETLDLSPDELLEQWSDDDSERLLESLTLDWMFDCAISEDQPESGCLWISSDESINTEHAALFVQGCLKVFEIDRPVGFEASHTCSKLKLDAFGGHAVFVTADRIEYMATWSWLNEQFEKHSQQERQQSKDRNEVGEATA